MSIVAEKKISSMSRARPTYPRPDPTTLHPEIDVHPRKLAPLEPLPPNVPLPPLPSPIRNPAFSPFYTLTTHLYPSAYPHAPSSHLPYSEHADDRPGETKEARVKRQQELVDHLWLTYANGEIPEHRKEILWNTVNRFVRNDINERQTGVTLFLAHANGMHKETWEPFLLSTFSLAERAGVLIDEVWAFDSVQHGDSGLINENVLGDVFDWADNARDILKFLAFHLPCTASSTSLPTHLPQVPDNVTRDRLALGLKHRNLVGIGHSLGGCSTLRAAIEYPSLFSSIILVDPVVAPYWAEPHETNPLARSAVTRRARWSSREEAMSTFRKSPFFQAWAPAVLEKYVEHALAPDPNGESNNAVRLKMPGTQEAIVFIYRRLCYETWQLMPLLDQRVEVRFLLSGQDNRVTGGDRGTPETVWRCRNATNVRMPPAGHLIAQEAPEPLAEEVVAFLTRKYGLKSRL